MAAFERQKAMKTKKLFGEKDFELDQEVRVIYHGKVTGFDVFDGCMKIETVTGLSHYVFDGDPHAIIMPVTASWPPKRHDVWLINGKVWHTDGRGCLVMPERADGSFGLARSAEALLNNANQPPELLFRFNV